MKIGLLTYYRSNVFGGFWQCLSHLQALAIQPQVTRVSLIPVLHTTNIQKLRSIQKSPQFILSSLRRYLEYQLQRRKRLGKFVLSGSIGLHDNKFLRGYVEENNIDLLITGADTCLDLTVADIQRQRLPIYWPDPLGSVNHALFSASCGDLSVSGLSDKIDNNLIKSIRKSLYLGFRDNSTQALFSRLNTTRIPSSFTPDPAFWGFQREVRSRQVGLKSLKSYSDICLVTLAKNALEPSFLKFFEQKYRIINLNTLSLKGFPVIFPGPISQLALISYSGFLITSSFHETIAAASLGIPFIAIERPSTQGRPFGMSKLSDLCCRLDCVGQYIDPFKSSPLECITNSKLLAQLYDLALANVESNKNAAAEMAELFEFSLRDFIATI